MPGGEIQNIEIRQREILSLKGPKEATAQIKAYEDTFIGAVDNAQTEMQNILTSVKSQEAQDYIQNAAGELESFLIKIAETGRSIIEAHNPGKKPGTPTLESLSSSLQETLKKQKDAIQSFQSIGTFEKTIGEISNQNDSLNRSRTKTDSSSDKTEKEKFLSTLADAANSVKQHPLSADYYTRVTNEATQLSTTISSSINETDIQATLSSFQEQLSSMTKEGANPDIIKSSLAGYYDSTIAGNPEKAKALWNSHIYFAKSYNTRWLDQYDVTFPRSGGIALDFTRTERQNDDYHFRIPIIDEKYGHVKNYKYEFREELSPSEESIYNKGIVKGDIEAQKERSKEEVMSIVDSAIDSAINSYVEGDFHDDAVLQKILKNSAKAIMKSLTPSEQSYLENFSRSGTVNEHLPYSNTDWSIKINNSEVITAAD